MTFDHVMSFLVVWFVQIPCDRSQPIKVLEILPTFPDLDQEQIPRNEVWVDLATLQNRIPVLEGVSPQAFSTVLVDQRFAHVTLSVSKIYPEMECELMGHYHQPFTYAYESVITDSSQLIKQGECNLDIVFPITVNELVFLLRSSAQDEKVNTTNRVVVTFDGSISDTDDEKAALTVVAKERKLLYFINSTCPKVTHKRLTECRCQTIEGFVGVMSTPRFVLANQQTGDHINCEHYTWQNDSVSEATLFVLLDKGRRCLFACEMDYLMSTTMKERILYSLQRPQQNTDHLSNIYMKMVFLTIAVILMGISFFFGCTVVVRIYYNRTLGLRSTKINQLMQARQRRIAGSHMSINRESRMSLKSAMRKEPLFEPHKKKNVMFSGIFISDSV